MAIANVRKVFGNQAITQETENVRRTSRGIARQMPTVKKKESIVKLQENMKIVVLFRQQVLA